MTYPIIDGRVSTRALEYHVADHCNLHCDHCCSFSPILKKWLADPAEFERDLIAIRPLVAPEFLKIVGGEPLLHPELETLLVIAKRLQVGPRIQLTTNAFLIERLTDRGWECLDMLAVSLYPEPALPKPLIRYIAKRAASLNIEVSWKMQDKFTCLDRDTRAEYGDAKQIFADCWIRHRCNSIKQGRFYCCTRPQYIQKFAPDADRYRADGVVVETADVHQIREHLTSTEPLNSCFICNGGNAPLAIHRQLTTQAAREKRLNLTQISA